nr:glycosyltransferase [Arthrobacter roseus]
MYCVHSAAPYNSNGYSTRSHGIVQGLRKQGADFVVAVRPGYPWDVKTDRGTASRSSFEEEIDGVRHLFSAGPSWTGQPLDSYVQYAADQYVQVAMQNRVSIIHAASNHVTALPALIAARRLGLPFVYEVRGFWEITEQSSRPGWEHTDRFALALQLETLVANEADQVLAITLQVADKLVSRGVASERITLLPNSVDVHVFSPLPAHQKTLAKLGIPDGIPVIGYAGSVVDYEGLDLLVRATGEVLSRGLDVRTVIVGDGPSLDGLRALTNELQLENHVTFTGRVPSSSVPLYLSCFDVVPSPRRRLPVTELVPPLKPLEAMASGKAVILTDLPPLRDLAGADGERARLCDSESSKSLADAIEATLRDTSGTADMTRRARLWTVKDRTWVKAAATLKKVYSQLGGRDAVMAQSLASLNIGIIADRFTTSGLLPETNLLQLTPDRWKQQMQETCLDALLVESAWEGGDGLWTGKIGFYDEASFAHLKALLAHCRREGIPTIFWNKEDPVHFNRFRVTAKYFDHVFTTDDSCIPRYLEHPGKHLKSVASLPFYAQPRLHNPLASEREYSHTISYAGSYYGDRYADRSRQLDRLLGAASPLGLTIYDRQHLNPDSPYHFPEHLARHVAGGLDYAEMVQAYKAHPIHINVNSVTESQTMFSRRVVEIAASGGAIISGPGRGAQRVLGGTVPVLDNTDTAAALMELWMSDESVRNDDAWLAMRTVFRAHTGGHRLTYALRTAGLVVKAPELESYVVTVETLTEALASELSAQSVLPGVVFCRTAQVEDVAGLPFDVRVIGEQGFDHALKPDESLIAALESTSVFDRTYFEDLLTSRLYVSWRQATVDESDVDAAGSSMVQVVGSVTGDYPVMTDRASTSDHAVRLRRRIHAVAPKGASLATSSRPTEPKMVVVAGHDLKFATALIAELESTGHTVLVDKWTDHNKHDEAHSRNLLEQADVIFCEWTLGNAVWYSQNKLPHQRLVTRFHLQELYTPFPSRLNMAAVDQLIFVGEHLRSIASRDYSIPEQQTRVIGNSVDIEGLDNDKVSGARFNLGLVGIIPRRKRLDRALDLLSKLRREDDRFHLYIKGKRPEDYPWMAKRTEEMDFYSEQLRRIEADPFLNGAVTFDPHGEDMPGWYRKIGVVLSLSDFESFHLTLADGAASGAIPCSIAWPGADQIYPTEWLYSSTSAMALAIHSGTQSLTAWGQSADAAKKFSVGSFNASRTTQKIIDSLLND